MTLKRSQEGRRRHDRTLFAVFIILFPYIVGFSPDSTSSYTETIVGVGTGQYVYHDCSGAHSQIFGDAGIYYGKKFEGPYRLGVNAGGWTAGKRGTLPFAYPDIALDWEPFSIGTTGIRIGRTFGTYFEIRAGDQPPLFSGRGALRAGVGGKFRDAGLRYWIGLNALPYDNLGLTTQLEIPLRENTFLFFNMREGQSSGYGEYGVSIGMRFINF